MGYIGGRKCIEGIKGFMLTLHHVLLIPDQMTLTSKKSILAVNASTVTFSKGMLTFAEGPATFVS